MDILSCWQMLQVAQDALTAKIEQTLEEESLSAREWIMLRVLNTQTMDRGGHFKMKSLAERVALSPSATTRLVTRLEDRNLLKRYICPTDRRGIYTDVTEEGQALLARTSPKMEALFSELGFPTGADTTPEGYFAQLVTMAPPFGPTFCDD